MPNVCSIIGFDASNVLTDAEVRRLFEELPSSHTATSVINDIEYVDAVKEEKDPRRRRFTHYQVFGDCSLGEQGSGQAHAKIYRQHKDGNLDEFWFKHTILHEVGHAVYYNLISTEDRATWATLHGGSTVIYNEQSRVPDEHFPNLYAAYILRHQFVRSRFRDFYLFFRERVFGDAR